MPWVRLDDDLPDHPKIIAAGPMASWLHVCALAYCNRYLTDGFVPEGQVPKLSSLNQPRRLAAALVRVGLWEEAVGGFRVHDFLNYQPSRVQVEAEREVDRKRKAAGRAAQGRDSNGKFSGIPPESDRNPSGLPPESEGTPSGIRKSSAGPAPSPSPSPKPLDNKVPTHVQQREPPAGQKPRDVNISKRMGAACVGRNRSLVTAEAEAVTVWARQYVDDQLIDEAIGFCAQANERPTLPRAIATLIRRKAADHHIGMPEFHGLGGDDG